MTALSTYAYLFANLAMLAVLLPALLWTRRRDRSRLALASGIACMPCSLLALAHEDAYWRPVRLGGGAIGVEDLVFTFVAGALVWLCAAWIFPRLAAPRPLLVKRAAGRIVVWGLASDAVLLALWRAGMDCMTATVAAALPLCAWLLYRRRALWPLALAGVACFVPVYTAIVKLQFALWPGYAGQWNPAGAWAWQAAGIPAGEIVWAAAFAALWPAVIASAFDVDLNSGGEGRYRVQAAGEQRFP